MQYSLQVHHNHPSDMEAWNKLCAVSGNFFQSTYYDEPQNFFHQQPVYFEAYTENQLTGGVKLYRWESRKLGIFSSAISKYAIQFGEIILTGLNENRLLQLINEKVNSYLCSEKIVKFTATGVYGNESLLIKLALNPNFVFRFNSAYVSIDDTFENIQSGFNENTKRNIKKAIKAGVIFKEENDIGKFLELEAKVYAQQQGGKPPSPDFVRRIFSSLSKTGKLQIHFAELNNEVWSSAFCVTHGQCAYYIYGGTIRNNFGTGQFLFSELMKYYRERGIKKFFFGQVAPAIDESNRKFSEGISNFKRGFGTEEIESSKKIYILKPFKNKLWEILLTMKK